MDFERARAGVVVVSSWRAYSGGLERSGCLPGEACRESKSVYLGSRVPLTAVLVLSMSAAWQHEERRPRLMVVGAGDRDNVRQTYASLRDTLRTQMDLVAEDFDFSQDLEAVQADLAVVLGGDGTILRAANAMGTNQLPVLGVNLGKLGFLAALSPSQLIDVLPDVCSGRFQVVDHLMFECSVVRDGAVVEQRMGLNEAAILAGPPYSMLDVDLYVDAEIATTYSCDGLIISTPVGSTAHSLSAGGPILRKNLQAFVISPISPHTLTVRPVVDTADRVYEMSVKEPHEATSIVVDGQVLCRLQADDRVRVQRARARFKLIEVRGHNYYRTLRDKLGWGGSAKR